MVGTQGWQLETCHCIRIENAHIVRKKNFIFYYATVSLYVVQLLGGQNRYVFV